MDHLSKQAVKLLAMKMELAFEASVFAGNVPTDNLRAITLRCLVSKLPRARCVSAALMLWGSFSPFATSAGSIFVTDV